jgi:aminoglycoside 6'-N-acetyltransferase I
VAGRGNDFHNDDSGRVQARVRRIELEDLPRWVKLRAELWPEESPAELASEGRDALGLDPALIVFVASVGKEIVGFLELGLRSVAEGCASSPVPYVEGWYVASGWRGRRIGGALMEAAEGWSRGQGYTELGSDALADNQISRAAHRALGFEEVETLVVFRKEIRAVVSEGELQSGDENMES